MTYRIATVEDFPLILEIASAALGRTITKAGDWKEVFVELRRDDDKTGIRQS